MRAVHRSINKLCLEIQIQIENRRKEMRHKTIALFMLVIVISSVSLFAGEADAKSIMATDNASFGSSISETASMSANDAASEDCCRGLAVVTFENYTSWKIRCYVDGEYVGIVYPGYTLSAWARSGWARPYGRAVFVDGSSLNWDLGTVFYSSGGNYSFPMYP